MAAKRVEKTMTMTFKVSFLFFSDQDDPGLKTDLCGSAVGHLGVWVGRRKGRPRVRWRLLLLQRRQGQGFRLVHWSTVRFSAQGFVLIYDGAWNKGYLQRKEAWPCVMSSANQQVLILIGSHFSNFPDLQKIIRRSAGSQRVTLSFSPNYSENCGFTTSDTILTNGHK